VNADLTLQSTARKLLGQIGCTDAFTLEPIAGGSNNRVTRVDCGEQRFVLKTFFHDEDDPRDRFSTELAFTNFAWHQKLRCVPQPLSSDLASRAILFSHARGKPMTTADVGVDNIEQAMDFLVQLNAHRSKAGRLPSASEPCFSLADHVQLVDMRIDRLRRFAEDELAREFVESKLTPVWQHLRDSPELVGAADYKRLLRPEERCLSPCDLGFHNALCDENGHITFVDFEYAGWDDPARTVCDFFCQIAVPIPHQHFDLVINRLSAMLPAALKLRDRVTVLMPIYRIKWCCILLNEYLPGGRTRREFADATGDLPPSARSTQLGRARAALARLTESGILTAGAA
jgi:hypothetical protein